MKTPITDKSLKTHGWIKKCNIYMKDGFSLNLIKGHTWIISKAKCQERDVNSIEYVENYISNPPEFKSSKVKY